MRLINPNQGRITLIIEDPSGFSRQVQADFETNWSNVPERELTIEQVTWQALVKLRESWAFMRPKS